MADREHHKVARPERTTGAEVPGTRFRFLLLVQVPQSQEGSCSGEAETLGTPALQTGPALLSPSGNVFTGRHGHDQLLWATEAGVLLVSGALVTHPGNAESILWLLKVIKSHLKSINGMTN